jgi:nucleoside-diphosphate-sugar epimerase
MIAMVTGSAGFVGRHLVDALRVRGESVIGLDRKTGCNLAWANTEETLNGLPRPDVIFHLAGSCSTLGSLRDPIQTFRDTVLTAVNVLDYARTSDIPVILTSSVKARDGKTSYGASKVMVEEWAQGYAADYGLQVVINRPGTIYGPGQEGSEESGWIAWFLKAKREGLPVVVNGDGDQMRDLLHVSDYVGLMLRQADDISSYTHSIWDVGGGWDNAVTVNEIVAHLRLEHTHGPDRHGDVRSYVGENVVRGWRPLIEWRESETLRGPF